MSYSFTASAHWTTVTKTGIPVRHQTRFDGLAVARKEKVALYRQEAGTGRVDIIYDPVKDLVHKPGEFTVYEGLAAQKA